MAIQLLGRADLEQAAHLHHADVVREREGLFLVVRDQDGRHADAPLHLAHGVAQLDADARIERAEGLVEQQHGRLVRERARHRDALLLAAGELAGVALVVALERDELQQLFAPLAPLCRRHAPHAQGELDVLRHGHVAEQGVVLEHHAHAALPGGQLRDVAPMQRDAPVVDRREPRERAQQRALAAARRPKQHEEFACLYLQRDVIDDRNALVELGDLVYADGHSRPSRWRRASGNRP